MLASQIICLLMDIGPYRVAVKKAVCASPWLRAASLSRNARDLFTSSRRQSCSFVLVRADEVIE
jgi:hypothetical protein